MGLKTKLVVKHKKDCYAVKSVKDGKWNSPWAYPYTHEWRDKRGGTRGASYIWHFVRCNDRDCPAVVMVENDSLMTEIQKAVKS